MWEREVAIPTPFGLAGVLCLPEDASATPAVALLGGSGADTRDGDLEPGWPLGTTGLPAPGTLRRIAHRLAGAGVATLRYDRRGFGASGGAAGEADYDSDLQDALAALAWLRARPEINPARVAVAGHSAGALTACHVCRDDPHGVAAAMLVGGLASSIEDLIRTNLGRVLRHWDQFTDEQRAWLETEMPTLLVRARGVERYLDAAKRGEPTVVLEGGLAMRTARTRQDLATDYAAEFRHVRVPALVLHAGDDELPAVDGLGVGAGSPWAPAMWEMVRAHVSGSEDPGAGPSGPASGMTGPVKMLGTASLQPSTASAGSASGYRRASSSRPAFGSSRWASRAAAMADWRRVTTSSGMRSAATRPLEYTSRPRGTGRTATPAWRRMRGRRSTKSHTMSTSPRAMAAGARP